MTSLVLAAALAAGAAVPAEPEALLIAVGDIRLDGPVGRALERYGPLAPTEGVRPWLKGDIVLGNLEEPVTARGKPVLKLWTFRAKPDQLRTLTSGGFTLLNLANNHLGDFGERGVLDTVAALDRAGLRHTGAGRDAEEARRPVFIEANGLKVGFLSMTSALPEFIWAGRRKAGVAYSDFDRLAGWVREAKASCDVLVVSFHGGTEKADAPNEVQRSFGRAAADAGADLVVAHHPHVLQAVELRGRVPILHSLGNFLFVSPTPVTRLGVIARVRLARGGVRSVEFVPVDTWTEGRLRPWFEASDAAFKALDADGALSAHPGLFRVLKSPSER
ncbi:MAG TPA: capsular biosynthesis protein [Elusimicrobia bacterium]|nr:capsular biosynthesis protein [Elusimicrobiota bacterium]